MKTFNLPDLGEGLSEAEIVTWHVSPGDRVVVDQPLVSVETDKAVVEVPSPYAGTVAALHAAAGDIVQIGAKLIDFDAANVHEDRGTVVGSVPAEEPAKPDSLQRPPAPAATVRAMPAVRALARKLGVDLAAVEPSGPNGVITAEDITRHASDMSGAGPGVPLHGVRRAMAQKMEQSHAEIVPASVHDEADVEDWIEGGDVTVALIRAIVAGCRVSPILNAWYNSADKSVRIVEKIDVGMAINTADGLFVAVMRDVASRDDVDLRRGLNNLKRAVAAREIPLEELRGATITLSNFGTSGAGRFANLIVVPPQVAIIGAGTIKPRVVAYEGKPAVRRTLPLSLTFDHRVATGIEAADFLKAMLASLERRPGASR
ncbi:MAG TPA: dihydrolipoamide acetyltransferase family protein [Micropepsaceae bacterium]|jgi:pyruvate dehydrogenase E2 component (dihydrolipoamide acetyltransferase)|nr:dihydrolipoamide acetyltransferase family protein [Micropepsaceae bacterium]